MYYSTEEDAGRFISTLSCILVCADHFHITCHTSQEAESVLSSISAVFPLSPIVRLILNGDSAPPQSLLYLFEGWWDVELSYRQHNYSQCQTYLHSFLQTHPNDSFFITYDLILLNINTSLFVPLCQSLLNSLLSCSNVPFTQWFVIRPALTPEHITLQQFFGYQLLLLLLEHAPCERRMIRSALSFCRDNEKVKEIQLIEEGSTDRNTVYGWM